MRSHYCADLGEQNIGEVVQLCGWCNTYRDHGGVVFIDLRDRSGIVQLAFDGEISPSSEWRLRKLAEAGALTKTAMKIIASYTGIQSEMLSEAVEIAALDVINELEPAFAKMAADGLVSAAPEVPASVTAKDIVSHYRR